MINRHYNALQASAFLYLRRQHLISSFVYNGYEKNQSPSFACNYTGGL
jgi:hypothetical protein